MLIERICYYCDGDGELEILIDPETGETQVISCSVCSGAGKLPVGTIDELDDLRTTVNDILDKCNDIFEKVNE